MDQILSAEILIRSMLLLHDKGSIKKAFTTIRKALEEAVKQGLISPKLFKEYRDLKRSINNGEVMKDQDFYITEAQLMTDLTGPKDIKNKGLNIWILYIFRAIPEEKYISRDFVFKLFPEPRKHGYHSITQTLGRLAKDGYLERFPLGVFKGDPDGRFKFYEENVVPPVQSTTQSVFRLTERGTKRIKQIIKFY